MRRRPRARAATGALAVLAAMVVTALAGCGASTVGPSAGASVAVPPLPGSDTLEAVAAARAEEMCDAGRVTPLDDDATAERYDQETWAAVAELAGSAPLGDGGEATARERVELGWSKESALTEVWDRRADAAVPCGDGRLYAVTALARAARATDLGAFGRSRYGSDEVEVTEAVRYGRAVDVTGRTVDLLLDLYQPTDAGAPGHAASGDGARPALVMVHGGGFAAGSRSMHTADARAYARRGFVVVSIDYRLDPDAGLSTSSHRAASRAALDDAMEAVRWLRSEASDLGVDPDRVAALGASAGGEIALGLALVEDATPTGPRADVSPKVDAAISTGAYLTPVLGQTRLDAADAPVYLQFYETDTASGRRWSFAGATCDAVRAAGATCDLAVDEGAGHTVALGPTGPHADRIAAFLAVHLRLVDG